MSKQTDDELLREAALAALLGLDEDEGPKVEPEAILSDETKEKVKEGGRLAMLGGKWAARKAKEVADRAADKARQTKAAAETKRAEQLKAKEAARLATEEVEREAQAQAQAQAQAEREAAEAVRRKQEEAAAEAVRRREQEAAEVVAREKAEREAQVEPVGESLDDRKGDDLAPSEPVSASVVFSEDPDLEKDEEPQPTPADEPEPGLLVTDGMAPPTPEALPDLVEEVPADEAPLQGVQPQNIEQALEKETVEPMGKDAQPSRSIPKSWLIAGGSLVLLGAIGAGAFYFLGGQEETADEVAVVAPSEEAPVPVETVAPVVDEVVEPVQEDLVATEEIPEGFMEETSELAAEVEEEAPVVEEAVAEVEIPEPEPAPVVEAPKPTPAPVAKAPAPRPAPARAPAPRPAPAPKKEEPTWQDEAMDAMDAWAKELDL